MLYWTKLVEYMKSFIAKRVISILVNLRYLRFKLLKYKENNKKICNTFDHNFKNIALYIMSNVSLERYYFVLYDGALTLKMSKMSLNAFCDKTLHIQITLEPKSTYRPYAYDVIISLRPLIVGGYRTMHKRSCQWCASNRSQVGTSQWLLPPTWRRDNVNA